MHAAVMQGGERPVYATFSEPKATDGSLVVAVRAAALTGFDRAVARRIHYFKMPEGPFVLGKEGVAETSDRRRIYFNVEAPVPPFGSMAERTLIDPHSGPCSALAPDGRETIWWRQQRLRERKR